jgi:hypothetical protein
MILHDIIFNMNMIAWILYEAFDFFEENLQVP